MKKQIIETIEYFAQFTYPPTAEEIYTFLPTQITKQAFHHTLHNLVRSHLIQEGKNTILSTRYTLPQYSIQLQTYPSKQASSFRKRKKIKPYITLLQWNPFIQFAGISGSLAMDNAAKEEDIDMFIITAPGFLWIGRLSAILLAELLGIHRRRQSQHVQDTVCLNLFFDQQDLVVPQDKQIPYVAHEVLQLNPMINKKDVYESFLSANAWIYAFFPNAKIQQKKPQLNISSNSVLQAMIQIFWHNIFFRQMEKLAQALQYRLIQRKITTERITKTQLWFFPDDYEQKITKV